MEIYQPHINTSPLFRLWFSLQTEFVHRLCNAGIDLKVHRPQDHLFSNGFPANHMYYLVSGGLSYRMMSEFGEACDWLPVKQRWLCEAALWCEWIHVGTALATTGLQVLRVEAAEVVDAINEFSGGFRHVMLEYGNAFHRLLVAPRPHDPPNDLTSPDYSELIMTMNATARKKIAEAALAYVQVHAHRAWHPVRTSLYSKRSLDGLRQEINQHTSMVMLNSKGELDRVTSIVALKIQQNDGQILVQLGKADKRGNEIEPCCLLPALKQKPGELVRDVAQRVIATKLHLLPGSIETITETHDCQWRQSPQFRVTTKYMRWEIICRLQLPPSDGGGPCPSVCKERAMQEIGGHEIFVLSNKPAKVKEYYAWLQPEQFEEMSRATDEARMDFQRE